LWNDSGQKRSHFPSASNSFSSCNPQTPTIGLDLLDRHKERNKKQSSRFVTKQSNCPLANRYIRQYANAAAPQQLDQDYKTPGEFWTNHPRTPKNPTDCKGLPFSQKDTNPQNITKFHIKKTKPYISTSPGFCVKSSESK